MWQGLWQDLLDNPSMQRTSRMFLGTLGLQMCDLPYVIDLDQVEDTDKENDPGSSPIEAPMEEDNQCTLKGAVQHITDEKSGINPVALIREKTTSLASWLSS
jgi:hypothetical protein